MPRNLDSRSCSNFTVVDVQSSPCFRTITNTEVIPKYFIITLILKLNSCRQNAPFKVVRQGGSKSDLHGAICKDAFNEWGDQNAATSCIVCPYIILFSYVHIFLICLNNVSYLINLSKGAKIRSRYNQVPHLTQDTNGKVTNSQ